MYITCVFLFVYDNIVCVLSRFMTVGCGWPGPVFSPVDKLYTLDNILVL